MDLDIFLREQNIMRYRRLLDPAMGSVERQTILTLLSEEVKKLRSEEHQKSAVDGLPNLDAIRTVDCFSGPCPVPKT